MLFLRKKMEILSRKIFNLLSLQVEFLVFQMFHNLMNLLNSKEKLSIVNFISMGKNIKGKRFWLLVVVLQGYN